RRVRPYRRRQRSLQPEPAGRRRQAVVPRSVGQGGRHRARDRARAWRVDLRRAWPRPHEAGGDHTLQVAGRDRPDADPQGRAGPQGHHEPRQGGLTPSRPGKALVTIWAICCWARPDRGGRPEQEAPTMNGTLAINVLALTVFTV